MDSLDFGEFIGFEVKKRFGIITFNRTNRANALTIGMLKNIKKAVEYCQESERIRGLILTGKGNSFTTGMDVGTIDPGDQELVKELESTAVDIGKLLYMGKPVICAINGKAMGDGVVYSICADYRIAVKEAYFQMPEIFTGIFPGAGTTIIMPKIIGIPWTKKILMFGEKVSAEMALKIGLIDKIVNTQEELIKETMIKAKFIATKPPSLVNGIKLCSNHFLEKPYGEAYELEKEALNWFQHDDKEQFIRDFRKKF